MLRRNLLLFCSFLILVFHPAFSWGQQPWSGLLSPARAIDWTGAGVTGGIPSVTTACAKQPTLQTGSSNASNNANAIANAINADIGGASPCVINLPAGTYYMGGSIVVSYPGKANLVIRGAGANSTFLIFSNTSSVCNGLGSTAICIYNTDNGPWYNPTDTVSWTSGYSQGTSTITLSGHNDLKVGSQIWLSQKDPSSDTGNVYPCATTGADGSCSQQGDSGVGLPGRTMTQSVTVTGCGTTTYGSACTSNTVSISPAIYAPNWSSSNSPQAGWSWMLPVSNVGIENLSTDVSNVGLTFVYMLHNASDDWISGVRSVNGTVQGSAAHEHVIPWQSNHITVQNSYFYGANPSSDGYGIAPSAGTDDSLFVNNICQHLPTCEITQVAVGNVFAYNYAVDNYFGSGWQQGDSFHHSAGDYYNLREGNIGILLTSDDIHGSAWFETLYRNYFSGYDPAGSPTNNVNAINHMAGSRYFNDVANVLGQSGKQTHYQYAMTSANDCGPGPNSGYVFALGDSDQNIMAFTPSCFGSSFAVYNDMLVASTLMRWGNWDNVTNAVRECKPGSGSPCSGDETGSAASTYPGLASPSTNFPASFVFSSTPSWWVFPSGTAAPFPGIGPDVSSGNISGTGGHANLNPAGNCYLNVMGGSQNGSSGALAFDPNNCYGSSNSSRSSAPQAPTNLSVVSVQ